jgi:thiamine biosynthesis lipoprotein
MKQYLLIPLFLALISCGGSTDNTDEDKTSDVSERIEFFGNTQGTTYSIIVNDPIDLTSQEVDSILHLFDLALSTYIDNSTVSKLNNAVAGEFVYEDKNWFFDDCYQMSQEVYKNTNGLFDPTVYPLVAGWGFFKDIENVPDSSAVDSLRALTSFNNGYHFDFKLTETDHGDTIPAGLIMKNTPGAKLDFNAIAQGQAVDVLADLIASKGAKNYFIEIGGEIKVSGKNSEAEFWRIGIDKPIENSTADDRVLQEIVQLENQAIATSGSYRKFYEKEGIKYSHTLNPKTGYPVKHSLLSATVVAESCALADAYATALMVMGPDDAIDFLKNNPELKIEAYLIFNNSKDRLETYYTEGFGELIVD